MKTIKATVTKGDIDFTITMPAGHMRELDYTVTSRTRNDSAFAATILCLDITTIADTTER